MDLSLLWIYNPRLLDFIFNPEKAPVDLKPRKFLQGAPLNYRANLIHLMSISHVTEEAMEGVDLVAHHEGDGHPDP